jgi:hypothetical protein
MTPKHIARCVGIGFLLLILVGPSPVRAQFPPPPPASAPAPPLFGAEELDQLLAPIALYPDPLLAQVLMAATYPLEIVEAARWVQAYPGVQGPALDAALEQAPWDPSVKSLTAVPQVLAMLSTRLDWTQKLGDAFLAQPQDVMATVQLLRAKAQAAGYLQSTPQATVLVGPQGIQILPPTPQVVYLPVYDPTVVYGRWWYPAYPPYAWSPPGLVVRAPFAFGLGITVGAALWGGFDWGHHSVHINVTNYNTFNHTSRTAVTWRHDPGHRRGVAYYDPGVRQQHGQGPRPGVAAREAYRGRVERPAPAPSGPGHGQPAGPPPQNRPRSQASPAPPQAAPPVATPARSQAAPPTPPAPRQPVAFEGFGRGGEARAASDRGRMSRQSMAAPHPAPAAPSPAAGRPAPNPASNRPGPGGKPGGEKQPHR